MWPFSRSEKYDPETDARLIMAKVELEALKSSMGILSKEEILDNMLNGLGDEKACCRVIFGAVMTRGSAIAVSSVDKNEMKGDGAVNMLAHLPEEAPYHGVMLNRRQAKELIQLLQGYIESEDINDDRI